MRAPLLSQHLTVCTAHVGDGVKKASVIAGYDARDTVVAVADQAAGAEAAHLAGKALEGVANSAFALANIGTIYYRLQMFGMQDVAWMVAKGLVGSAGWEKDQLLLDGAFLRYPKSGANVLCGADVYTARIQSACFVVYRCVLRSQSSCVSSCMRAQVQRWLCVFLRLSSDVACESDLGLRRCVCWSACMDACRGGTSQFVPGMGCTRGWRGHVQDERRLPRQRRA